MLCHQLFPVCKMMRIIKTRYSSPIFSFILAVCFFFPSLKLHAEPWKCGTPLLCDNLPPIQDNIRTHTDHILSAPAAPANVGQSYRFFVHIPIASINTICVAVGKHCYIFIEDEYQDMLTEAEAMDIAETFDTEIYPKVHHWIGSEVQPGLDRDNKITILLHDVGMNGSGREYGGYFSPVDLHPTSPTSNRRDMLYMDIFQFKQRSRFTFYSSLTHEFAHLINWYQNGGTTDQRWLEEGIASFTEWGVYGNIHTLFVDEYFAEPSMSLTTANTFATYYGGAFLFLLYLYENHGGINFIRKLADEDKLGLPAIDASLGGSEKLVDIFLNWGAANWFNNQIRGNKFRYRNLSTRKVTARTARISRYPTTSANIPIESWGIEYFLFQNLPEKLDLTLNSNAETRLYANIAYFAPNRITPIVKAVPTTDDENGKENLHINHLQVGNLSNDGQILLIVTTEFPQTFQYVAKETNDVTTIDIGQLIQTHRRDFQHSSNLWSPQSVTHLPQRDSQPVNFKQNLGFSIIPGNQSVELEPISQIHLSSNYNKIEVKDNIAYVTSDWGLEIFSLNPSPTHIGEVSTPGLAQALALDGEFVYVADGKAGVHQINVAQSDSPQITKTLGGFQEARDVHIAHENLYTLDTLRGLLIFNLQDVHNNPNPKPRRSYNTPGTPLKVSTNNEGQIYISDTARGLYILTPDQLGGFAVSNTIPLLVPNFQILGKYVLAASGDLRVLNIPNMFQTDEISRTNTSGLVSALNFFDGLLYLTDRQSGLYVVNINDAQSSRIISSHPTIGNAEDVALRYSAEDRETYAYVADGYGGIQTIKVTHHNDPIWVNHFNAHGVAHALDVKNNGDFITIAIANGSDGLKIAEFADTFTGKIVHNIRTTHSLQSALCAKIHEQFVFVGTDTGMDVVDLNTGDIVRHLSTNDPVWEIDVIGDYAYLCSKSLIVVDIALPEQSRIITRRTFPGAAYRIVSNEVHAFIAALDGGVHVIDITEPSQPRPISTFSTVGAASNVVLDNQHLYVLDNHDGVLKIEIQNPEQLIQIDEYVDTRLPIAAAVQGDKLYLLDIDSLQVIDTQTLTRLSRYTQLQAPTDVAIVDSGLYVTERHQLKVLRINLDPQNLAVEEYTGIHSDERTQISVKGFQNQLHQNFPNPFNPETWIPYALADPSEVSLTIYDAHGRHIINKSLGFQHSGKHSVYWDGKNNIGERVASGIYYYQLTAKNFTNTRKMVIRR